LNVLVVDDDPDISQLLISSLGRAGYRISSVTSGEDAITLLIEQPMDLIFLDVLMPGMSGLQVLECIRDADSWLDMAIILTTAHGSEGVAIDALRRGADDYLRKPFDSRDLRVTLGRTVGLLELRRQNASLQRQLEEKHRRLEAELARAALVQADLLPRGIPNLPGYDLAARCIPARDVGGDFYDWHMPNAQLLNLTFGDVMGKGMPAALLMTTVRAVMRSAARATSPVTNMTYAATVLEPDLERAESFVTMFHAQLDLKTNRLTYVDCGHGCVFIRHADGSVVEELEPRGIPLGVPRFDAFAEGMVVLEPGDTLIVYSDGLLDARPDLLSTGNWFLGDVIAGAEHAPAVIDRLIALVDLRFPPPDDLTIVALRRLV
jgi:serine phosphatase RsbU (regulator of sigma subunit)